MNAMTSKLVAVVGLASLALAGAPAVASAGGATLYELTENMKIVTSTRHGKSTSRRTAMSALTGAAALNTPPCPNVSLVTGQGALPGTFTPGVQGDNPVDGPEAVVLSGAFTGLMDFSPAIVHQTPYGSVTGRIAAGRKSAPFTGIFRLPFAGNVPVEVSPGYFLTLRQIFCPASPTPNPYAPMYGGYDLAYLDFDAEGQLNGQCLDIQPTELSLGAPLVRFDVQF